MEGELYIKRALGKLVERKSLSFDEAKICSHEIIGGKVPHELVSALLVALRMKGETAEEIAGFAQAMLEMAVNIKIKSGLLLLDTCGTGGDGLDTFNASTCSAIILSAMGFYVAKHGNRAVSSSLGSADILEKIGLNIVADPQMIGEELEKKRFVFLFAPLFHPAMKNVAPVRRSLGIRTIFNILGPLTNPARPNIQLIGVFSEDYAEKVAEAITILGKPENALIVSGRINGKNLDEISPCGETLMINVKDREIKWKSFVAPEDMGMKRRLKIEDIVRGENPVDEFLAVLEGRISNTEKDNGKEREDMKNMKKIESLIDFVSLNAGALLKIMGDVREFKDGYEKVKNYIVAGKVKEYIQLLRS